MNNVTFEGNYAKSKGSDMNVDILGFTSDIDFHMTDISIKQNKGYIDISIDNSDFSYFSKNSLNFNCNKLL